MAPLQKKKIIILMWFNFSGQKLAQLIYFLIDIFRPGICLKSQHPSCSRLALAEAAASAQLQLAHWDTQVAACQEF